MTYEKTYDKMLDAYEATTPAKITETTPPKGAKRAWSFRSYRGWFALQSKLETRRTTVPLLVEDDAGELYLCEAAAKMLAPNTFGYLKGEKRIGRKGYFHLDDNRVEAIRGTSSYFADWCWRKSSTHTTCDTLDVAAFLLGLKGVKTTPVEIIASYAA